MGNVACSVDGEVLRISFIDRIDSTNAAETEREIGAQRSTLPSCTNAVIDAANLTYISSAGLRIILRLLKEFRGLSMENVSPDIYEILETTGFTEMIEVRKAYRVISIDGCEAIGQGANGLVYRIDPDTIVKVYFNPEALPEIKRERELARTAFVLGIPTAIPYDVVRVGDGYGSVFELLDAKSFAQLLTDGEKSIDEIAQMSVDLLKLIHGTVVRENTMPDMRSVVLGWVDFLKGHLPEQAYDKLHALVEAVPEDHHMLHGDYHIKNVMYQNGESLLIDMDTLCYGNPVFELGSMYNAYQGFASTNHHRIEGFLGIGYDTSAVLWHKILSLYLDTDDDERISEVDRKAQVIGYTRLLRRSIRRNEGGSLDEDIVTYRAQLEALLDEVDSLVF